MVAAIAVGIAAIGIDVVRGVVLPYCTDERVELVAGVAPAWVIVDEPVPPAFPGTELHPVLWAQTARSYLAAGDTAIASRLADELWAHAADGWLAYDFDWPDRGQEAPWYSALAQGEALGLFTELGMMDRADVVAGTFTAPIVRSDGWLIEYPGHPPVLNGAISAAYGLYVYWDATGEGQELLERSIKAIARDVHRFRHPGEVSAYTIDGRGQDPTYHPLVVRMLRSLAAISSMECLDRAAQDFASDA